MKSIMELPENPEVYSNSKTLISLSFPFLGNDEPVERFSIKDGKFWYIGRKAFDDVLKIIKEFVFGDGYMKCFIYGTIGYGKSHILATIVWFLLRTGKRVVYLPDFHELAIDPVDYVKSALYLAYENNNYKINKIYTCKTLNEIEKFCKEESEPLYIVVGQMNFLDSHNSTEIIEFLNRIARNHFYIKSSSANNRSVLCLKFLKVKQTNEKRIELYGGFDKDEMSQWWIKNDSKSPLMNDKQKEKLNISPDEIHSF
ncbi:hypothetical protein RhiirA1_113727 [Rhizophagus irregularis]|uniref:Uncharacterized protein n=1 Tax=Rhizophagus irregularis TaxID=588596 RepID=A0A2I1F6U3_9GLOM|nr:hypothetical protein RhiirA1_113727 [Rhizophagus irregularis]PKY30073.1 hypothetical protein RhiirB3_65004 [Rhizophagus irregularis]